MRKARAEKLQEPLGFPDPETRSCDVPGCPGTGEFRAPKSRERLTDYFWFCLDHVRDYNRAWNYYAGMSPEEIEWHVVQDLQWQRPTWRLGERSGTFRDSPPIDDPMGVFEEPGETKRGKARRKRSGPPQTEEEKAFSVLDLDESAEMDHIKAKYIALVKQLHPDVNGGDKAAEEKLKLVNRAYATLRNGRAR